MCGKIIIEFVGFENKRSIMKMNLRGRESVEPTTKKKEKNLKRILRNDNYDIQEWRKR